VASFFVSRVDTLVDKKLDALAGSGPEERRKQAHALRGKVAIANARLAYEAFEQTFGADRFRALAAKGARRQRPLWASTSTKGPRLRAALLRRGPGRAGLGRHHAAGHLRALREGRTADGPHPRRPRRSPESLRALSALGIDASQVAADLEKDGEQKFVASFEQVVKAVEEKTKVVA
jgi:transaldolase